MYTIGVFARRLRGSTGIHQYFEMMILSIKGEET